MRRSATFIGPRTVGIFLASLLALYAGDGRVRAQRRWPGPDARCPALHRARVRGGGVLSRPPARASDQPRPLARRRARHCLLRRRRRLLLVRRRRDGSDSLPSFADAGYIALYPLVYVGLGLCFARERCKKTGASGLDGAIAGLTIGAVASALLFSTVIDVSGPGSGATSRTSPTPWATLA